MPSSCVRDSTALQPRGCHLPAYQLTVTPGGGPRARTAGGPSAIWVGVGQVWVQRPKTQQNKRHRMDATGQRYGPVRALSTAGALRLIHHFDRLFALPRPPELGECPPRSSSPLLQQKDFP